MLPDKTIVQKLTLKPGQGFLLLYPPKGYRESLGILPEAVKLMTKVGENADLIQIFATSKKQLMANLPKLKDNLAPKA